MKPIWYKIGVACVLISAIGRMAGKTFGGFYGLWGLFGDLPSGQTVLFYTLQPPPQKEGESL